MADVSRKRYKDKKEGRVHEESIQNKDTQQYQCSPTSPSFQNDPQPVMSNNPDDSYSILGRNNTQPVDSESWGEYGEPSTSAYTLEAQQESNFIVMDNPTRFFAVGRVFKTLWSEPAGTTAKDTEEPFYNEIRGYSELSFTKERRFVVVRKRLHSSLCIAIFTYGGQGATKDHIRSQDHALVFDASRTVLPRWSEEASDKPSFPIIVENSKEQIDPMSRLDFSRIYTVEHNVKVSKLGRISPEYLPLLEKYFVASILGDEAKNNMVSTFAGLEGGIRGLGLQDDNYNDATLSIPQVDSTVSGPNRHIRGTQGYTEKLDKSYQVRNKDYRTFFRVGRVFSTLWTEGVGIDTGRINPTFVSEVIYQEKVHSKVRQFLVVKYREGDRACTCVPVTSYDGLGAQKRGITLGDHGFICNRKNPPTVDGMLPIPLKLKLSPGSLFTDPSLVNFGKVYTIETNVKVKGIGEIDKASKSILQKNFQRVFLGSNDSTSSGVGDLAGIEPQIFHQGPSLSNESYATSMPFYDICATNGGEISANHTLYSQAYSTETSYTQPTNYNVVGLENTQGVDYYNNYDSYTPPSFYQAVVADETASGTSHTTWPDESAYGEQGTTYTRRESRKDKGKQNQPRR